MTQRINLLSPWTENHSDSLTKAKKCVQAHMHDPRSLGYQELTTDDFKSLKSLTSDLAESPDEVSFNKEELEDITQFLEKEAACTDQNRDVYRTLCCLLDELAVWLYRRERFPDWELDLGNSLISYRAYTLERLEAVCNADGNKAWTSHVGVHKHDHNLPQSAQEITLYDKDIYETVEKLLQCLYAAILDNQHPPIEPAPLKGLVDIWREEKYKYERGRLESLAETIDAFKNPHMWTEGGETKIEVSCWDSGRVGKYAYELLQVWKKTDVDTMRQAEEAHRTQIMNDIEFAKRWTGPEYTREFHTYTDTELRQFRSDLSFATRSPNTCRMVNRPTHAHLRNIVSHTLALAQCQTRPFHRLASENEYRDLRTAFEQAANWGLHPKQKHLKLMLEIIYAYFPIKGHGDRYNEAGNINDDQPPVQAGTPGSIEDLMQTTVRYDKLLLQLHPLMGRLAMYDNNHDIVNRCMVEVRDAGKKIRSMHKRSAEEAEMADWIQSLSLIKDKLHKAETMADEIDDLVRCSESLPDFDDLMRILKQFRRRIAIQKNYKGWNPSPSASEPLQFQTALDYLHHVSVAANSLKLVRKAMKMDRKGEIFHIKPGTARCSEEYLLGCWSLIRARQCFKEATEKVSKVINRVPYKRTESLLNYHKNLKDWYHLSPRPVHDDPDYNTYQEWKGEFEAYLETIDGLAQGAKLPPREAYYSGDLDKHKNLRWQLCKADRILFKMVNLPSRRDDECPDEFELTTKWHMVTAMRTGKGECRYAGEFEDTVINTLGVLTSLDTMDKEEREYSLRWVDHKLDRLINMDKFVHQVHR